MITARETIYAAVKTALDALATAGTVKTVSRRLRHWADMNPAEQPAIFMIQKSEVPAQVLELPTAWRLNLELYVYVNSGDDPYASPAVLLNPILDAIEGIFSPSEDDWPKQTLSNIVSHCWISGPIETSEGVLGEQEVAIIPIEILTT